MDIKSPIEIKYKKGNQLLFSRDSACLQNLIRLIELQKHRTLVMWAFDCAQKPLALFEAKYPNEHRPRKALELSESWARGTIKMPKARRAILDAHAVAKELDDRVYIALTHAIGHAGATVHAETHALGLVFYELTAIVFDVGLEKCDSAVTEKINYYYERLLYWQENIDLLDVKWAKFLADDTRPNKEKLWNKKRRNRNLTLRLEEEKDFRAVENLTREAFWNVYKPGCNEHFILHKLRSSQAFIKELDFVAELGGAIVGNIVYSKAIVVDDAGTKHEVITFGPISVLPSRQRQGIGSKLIEHTVEIAKGMGFKAIIIFGNPSYYHRFGFVNAEMFDIHTAEGENFEPFMAKELYAGALQGITGRFVEDEAFHASEAECELFDQAFPTKEKKVTDTQLFK